MYIVHISYLWLTQSQRPAQRPGGRVSTLRPGDQNHTKDFFGTHSLPAWRSAYKGWTCGVTVDHQYSLCVAPLPLIAGSMQRTNFIHTFIHRCVTISATLTFKQSIPFSLFACTPMVRCTPQRKTVQ